MLISCITFTNGYSDWQINESINSFYAQTYPEKQLIIINNRPTLKECLEFKILFHKDVCIIDRPGLSNANALLNSAKLASGQVIAHFPFDFYSSPKRLELSLKHIIEYKSDLVSPPGYIEVDSKGELHKYTHPNYTIGELCVYKRPAFRDDLDIDIGVWWQYTLLTHKHGHQIISIENIDLALKIPYAKPPNFNLDLYKWT